VRVCAFFIYFFGVSLGCWGAEEQQHGLVFERWICDTFFHSYRPAYTGKWDIPAEINGERGGIPVNPKATKWGTAVNLGDALRQFAIDEPFWLVIGYWEQRGSNKEFVRILAKRVEVEEWRRLWGEIRREDLERLDRVIKDRELGYEEVREKAKAMKAEEPFAGAIMQVNPKIDTGKQRRLQCSLRFIDLFRWAGEDVGEDVGEGVGGARLWGEKFPNPVPSASRSVKK